MKEINRWLTGCIALSAVAVAFGVSWFGNRPESVVAPTMTQVTAEARNGGYRLIDAPTLLRLYEKQRDGTLLIDTRQEWEHRRGHIDGSLHFPMEPTWWAMWRKKKPLQTLLGPDRSKTIVFY